jgi:hypothetical protein
MDREWSLSVLDTFHEYCDNFVAAGKINAGTVWVLKASKAVEKINRSVVSLADVFQMDKNIWSQQGMIEEKHKVLSAFAAQPSTTHHVERGVKLGAFAKKTGKQKLKVLLHVMASNPFREFTRKEFEEQLNDDDDDEEREMMTMKVK